MSNLKQSSQFKNTKRNIIHIFLCLLVNFFSISQCIAQTSSTQEDVNKIKSFVESGLNYIKQHGTKIAYAEFNKPNGKFTHDDMYLFVLNYNGFSFVNGGDPNKVGKNLYDYQDKYGVKVNRLMILMAKSGGGFISYYWSNPKTNKIELKTSYIKPVGDGTFIAGGLYKFVDVIKSKPVQLEELKAFVNFGIEYLKQNGSKQAYEEFNNTKGKFVINGKYLFVINYQGICLAHGMDIKDYVGKNLYDRKDEFGTPYIQLMIAAAKDGGGIVSYYSLNHTNGKLQFKTSYVKPLSGNAFIGAEIYEEKL